MSSSTLPPLPTRDADSHKGDYGRVVLIGGSIGMSGAISLAGLAALRSGAGLVTIAAPSACVPTIAAHEASYMTAPVKMTPGGTIAPSAKLRLAELCQSADCVGLGPGLGHNAELARMVSELYAELARPMVVDADGLNCLAAQNGQLHAPAPRILTPHPGEFRRLVSQENLPRAECLERAPRFAAENQCVLVLKGHGSLVTDGTQSATNETGNPGMATGGTGDVLTGVLCALVAQGLSAWDATRLAVHLHGLAGDLAAKKLGQHSMIASDVVRFLPRAFRRYASSCSEPS